MTLGGVIHALALPPETRVDQRIPKKMLLEKGASTASHKRQVQVGVEELRWVAALRPGNVGIPAYRDEQRAYLEIAVLTLVLRPEASTARLIELVHRAIPYPVLLVAAQEPDLLSLSLVHKRLSRSDADSQVLDGEMASTSLNEAMLSNHLASLALAERPQSDLLALYQGWCEWTEAARAARVTGRFALAATAEAALARRDALHRHDHLERQVAGLRAQAAREKQLNRRVELNLTIQRLSAELAEAITDL